MNDAGAFPTLFPKLDGLMKAGTVKEWSVSVCSLEEVFLRVADGMHEADGDTKEKRRGPPAAVPSELPTARK